MTEIRASHSPGETRVAAVRNGVLLDYAIDRPGAPDGVGDRLRGRVGAVVPGMAGAFVVLPDRADGFLPDSEGAAGLGVGDAVTVRVTRAAQGGKGPRLSARTEQAGPGAPALLDRGPDAIARLRALHPGAPVLVDDPALHPGQAGLARPVWDEGLAAQVESLAGPLMALPGGLVASIHPTPALVAIDLDLPDAGPRAEKAAAQKQANLAGLPALARAIRLRNLSGAILIDLAGMAVRARASLAPALEQALASDPVRPRLLGFTALGLAEIVRPRIHPPLHELLEGPHAAGLAALRALDAALAAGPAAALRLVAAPDVSRAIEADAAARADLARRTGRPLILRTDPALPAGATRLESIARAALA